LFYLFCLLFAYSYFFFWLAFTFSFWRQKEKGNKKKNRRLQFRTGCEASLKQPALLFAVLCFSAFRSETEDGIFGLAGRSSPLAKSLWGVFASLFFDPFFCFGASFGAKSLRSFVLFLVPLLVILFGKVGISLPAKVSWSL